VLLGPREQREGHHTQQNGHHRQVPPHHRSRGSACLVAIVKMTSAKPPASSRPSTAWLDDMPSRQSLMNRTLTPHVTARAKNCASTRGEAPA
jgi:hypothetical protein